MFSRNTYSVSSILLLIGVGFGLVGCGELQPKEAISQGTQSRQGPETRPVSTSLVTRLPQPVPSTEARASIPVPVETVQALATSAAQGATVQTVLRVTATAHARPVLEKDYGSWSFIVRRPDGHIDYRLPDDIYAQVRYDSSTAEGLRAYTRASGELAAALAAKHRERELEVPVIFNRYLSVEEFSAWVSARGLRMRYVELRVVYDGYPQQSPSYTPPPYQSHEEITPPQPSEFLRIESLPTDTEPLPRARVDEEISRQLQAAKGYRLRTIEGVYFTVVSTLANRLPEIANDPLVFHVDVTLHIIHDELQAMGITDASQVPVLFNATGCEPSSFFWCMQAHERQKQETPRVPKKAK